MIEVEELFDYMNCPLHHYFKYVKSIPDLNKSSKDNFNTSIEKVIRSFYYSLLDEKFLTPYELKLKWQAVCKSLEYTPDSDETKHGLATLMQFHDWAKDNCGVGFDIDREYLIDLGEHKVHGKLPIVRQKFDKTIDILHLKFWNVTIDTFKVETDIAFPINVLAFNTVYKSSPESISIYNCKTGKDLILRFSSEDCKRAQATMENVCNAMSSGIKYPRWNIYCNNCAYKPQCRSWKG